MTVPGSSLIAANAKADRHTQNVMQLDCQKAGTDHRLVTLLNSTGRFLPQHKPRLQRIQ